MPGFGCASPGCGEIPVPLLGTVSVRPPLDRCCPDLVAHCLDVENFPIHCLMFYAFVLPFFVAACVLLRIA